MCLMSIGNHHNLSFSQSSKQVAKEKYLQNTQEYTQ